MSRSSKEHVSTCSSLIKNGMKKGMAFLNLSQLRVILKIKALYSMEPKRDPILTMVSKTKVRMWSLKLPRIKDP